MPSKKASLNVVSISNLKITPTVKMKFHRKKAVASLRKNNFVGFRFHSRKVADINTRLIIARMKSKRGV